MSDVEDLVETLRRVEERLRELTYDRLREAAEGDEDARIEERGLEQARRAVTRALKALGAEPDPWS